MESIDFFNSNLPTFLVRGIFAIVCGGAIGIERERRGKPAGFRTNTLICLGSALYMLVADFVINQLGLTNTDPTRIASQVVTGIGFLGAGTIIQSRGEVIGLTSAATIWVVAAIGLLIGAGFPLFGLVCTAMVLFTLIGLAKIEPKILGKCHFVDYKIVFSNDGGRTQAELASTLAEHGIDMSSCVISKVNDNDFQVILSFCDKHPSHSRYLAEIWQVPGILEVSKLNNNSNHHT